MGVLLCSADDLQIKSQIMKAEIAGGLSILVDSPPAAQLRVQFMGIWQGHLN
jgi:ABC-type sugar transport system substrate-binding protein